MIKPKRTLQDALIQIEKKSAYWPDFLEQDCFHQLLKTAKNGLIALYNETPTIEVDAELRDLLRSVQTRKTAILPKLDKLSSRALMELRYTSGWDENIFTNRHTLADTSLRNFVKSLVVKSTSLRNPQRDKNWVRENRRKYVFRLPSKNGRPPVYSYELRYFVNSIYVNYIVYSRGKKHRLTSEILEDTNFLFIIQDCIDAIGIADETSEKQLVKVTFEWIHKGNK